MIRYHELAQRPHVSSQDAILQVQSLHFGLTWMRLLESSFLRKSRTKECQSSRGVVRMGMNADYESNVGSTGLPFCHTMRIEEDSISS